MNTTVDYIIRQLCPLYSREEARELALWILEESTAMSRAEILACKGTKNIPNLENILQRIAKKEPIQYIFNHCLWDGLDLKVTPATLIPRPETAELVNHVLTLTLPQHPRVIDIGTGSGCIAIALKKQRADWNVWGMDISPEALQVAQENAARNQVDVTWMKGDILSDEINDFDLIVSNPPYVCISEQKDMEHNVLDYEPHSALFVPDEDPLLYYRRIAGMRKAEQIAFEISQYQGYTMQQMMKDLGYDDVKIYKDSYGNERILTARITR